MPASISQNLTLADLERRRDPNGMMVQIIELMSEFNEMYLDMPVIPCNKGTEHFTTVRTGLPTPTWVKMYGGVQPSKSTVAEISDTPGILEDYSMITKRMADINNNSAAWRFSEEKAFMEGFAQTVANALIYENEATTPEAITGLAPRFNDLSAGNADNIIDAGGTGSTNRSIWLVNWGETTVHGIVPQGMGSGLIIRDLGEDTDTNIDGSNGYAQVLRSHYQQALGLTVRDWRYVVRICNIDRTELTVDASSGPNLPNLMFQALSRMYSMNGKVCAYMDRDTRTFYQQQLEARTSGSTLTWENVGGIRTAMHQGIPFRRMDALNTDEARVV